MSLEEKFRAGKRVVTAEITPPKGAGVKRLLQNAAMLSPHVDAINITDCQRALVKMSSLAACRVLLDHGHEPVLQMTCRDRNSIALQADLMGASALGIRNVLCLTGDPVKVGDSPQSKSVFEVEAVKLLTLVGNLQRGQDGSGHKLNAPTRFFLGAVVNPTMQQGASQLGRMEKKIEAGARFFQTQANYDIADLRAFLEAARPLGAKVLAGILVLHTGNIARYIHENIPGIRMPQSLLDRFAASAGAAEAEAEEQIGIDFAVETMLNVEDICDGFHLMSVRAEEVIPKVLEKYHAVRKASQDSALPLSPPTGR